VTELETHSESETETRRERPTRGERDRDKQGERGIYRVRNANTEAVRGRQKKTGRARKT